MGSNHDAVRLDPSLQLHERYVQLSFDLYHVSVGQANAWSCRLT